MFFLLIACSSSPKPAPVAKSAAPAPASVVPTPPTPPPAKADVCALLSPKDVQSALKVSGVSASKDGLRVSKNMVGGCVWTWDEGTLYASIQRDEKRAMMGQFENMKKRQDKMNLPASARMQAIEGFRSKAFLRPDGAMLWAHDLGLVALWGHRAKMTDKLTMNQLVAVATKMR